MPVNRILLVEGKDDEHVLKHICGNRGIPKLDSIIPLNNVTQLLESLPVRLKASQGNDIVGVVIDADISLAARWQALRAVLLEVKFENVPRDPDPQGTILDPPVGTLLPRVGIWIMPNNKTDGILEDFLEFLVPSGSVLFRHAAKSIAAIPEQERHFKEVALPKVKIHTWLAWQAEPGLPYGTAITARYLDVTLPEADVLVSWLERLYSPCATPIDG